MAKLIVLALAFSALVAFASAYTTIVTTTFDDDEYPIPIQQCRQQLQGQRLNQCQKYLQQGLGSFDIPFWGQSEQGVQQCCNELERVDPQCQCAAVQQVYQKAQQMQGQQGFFGRQKIQQLKEKAQNLPNRCNLQVQQCRIPTVISTTTTIAEDNRQSGSQSQESCYQRIQGQRFQQCQSYIQQAQQSGSYGPLLMSNNRQQGQQFQQELQQCCNELERVETECQCEALQEVYRQAQKQQQPWSQQGSRRGGQQGQQMQGLRPIIEKLRNQCNIQVQQCRIPSAMF